MIECINCKFFSPIGHDRGECRRYAPRAKNEERPWEIVYRNDWCGEFERKPVENSLPAIETEIRARYWKNRTYSSEMGSHVEKATHLAKVYGLSISRVRDIVHREAPWAGYSFQKPTDL